MVTSGAFGQAEIGSDDVTGARIEEKTSAGSGSDAVEAGAIRLERPGGT